MVLTLRIFIFFLTGFATLANCGGTGSEVDPFSAGYDMTCQNSYNVGCKIGGLNPENVSDASSEPLASYLAQVAGFTAGFACGLCESVLFGGGNTTEGEGKGAQCGNNNGDREAECCKNNGPQCGDNTFQETYNVVYPLSCKSGYQIVRGNVEQGSLIYLGSYFAGIICGGDGFQACSPVLKSQTFGSGNDGLNILQFL